MKTTTICLCACLAVITLASPITREKRRITVRVPAPGLSGPELINVLVSTPDILYHDTVKNLTAYKSSQFHACFIFDLDLGYWPRETDLQRATVDNVPEVLMSPQDERLFRQRAGPYIGPMCSSLLHYWLQKSHPTPPPLPHRDPQAPPSPHLGPQTPPPVSLYLQQQAERSGQTPPPLPPGPPVLKPAGSGPEAPPPVSVYQAQQAGGGQPETPPPLSLWQAQ